MGDFFLSPKNFFPKMNSFYVDDNYPHNTNNIMQLFQTIVEQNKNLQQQISQLQQQISAKNIEIHKLQTQSERLIEKMDLYLSIQDERRRNKLIRSYYKTGLVTPFLPMKLVRDDC